MPRAVSVADERGRQMSLEIVTIVGGPIQTNAYLVADTATGDALVIDAPHETASQIVEEAARRGWTIGQIVITHTHWDHILDAKALQEATGVPLAGASPGAGAAGQSGRKLRRAAGGDPAGGDKRDPRRRRYGDAGRVHLHRPAPARARSGAHRSLQRRVPRAKRFSSVATCSSPVGMARRRFRAPIRPSRTPPCAASPPSCRRRRR